MEQEIRQGYLSKTNSYLVACPYCWHSRDMKAADLPAALPNPFLCKCPCGKSFRIQLIAFRKKWRKSVDLVGSLTLRSGSIKAQMPCIVHDISIKGVRVSIEPVKHLSADAFVQAFILLDNQTANRLEIPCKIRRIIPDKNRLILGMEFQALDASQIETLGACVVA